MLLLFFCFLSLSPLPLTKAIDGWSWLPTYYDDAYITNHLDGRYPYLKLDNGSYKGPRDYFNFSHVHRPNREYLEQVNLEQYLYEEIKSMEMTSSIASMDQWHYSDDQLQVELDGESDPAHCLEELRYLADQVRRAELDSEYLFAKGVQNQRTLQLLDTWARPPSETYFGSSYWTGSYRGCKLLDEHRYCWAKIRARDWPEREEIIPPTSIRVGVCLPDSCNTKLANENKALILDIMKFNFSPLHRARFNKLIHVYCLPKQPGTRTFLSGQIFRIIVANWILLIVVLSVFAAFVGKEKLPRGAYNLTIQENYRKFAADDEPPKTNNQKRALVDLRPIGVTRFFTTVAVCLGHCAFTAGWVTKSSTFTLKGVAEPSFVLQLSLMKSNDIFWIIGGLLTSYTMLSRFKSRKQLLNPTVYIGIIVGRYLRLAAIQVLVLSFIKAIYVTLGEGPFWDYGTYKYSLQGQCQQSSWWRVLLIPILFSRLGENYKHECLPVSWHIVADIKLSLIAPALVYLMATVNKSTRWLVVVAVSLISFVAQYNDLSKQQILYFEQFFRYSPPEAVNMLAVAFEESGYFNIWTRLFPLTLGLLAGVYLYERKQPFVSSASASSSSIVWPRWMKGWFFLAMIGYQVYDWFTQALAQDRYLKYGEIPSESLIKWSLLLKPRVDCIMFAIIIARMASDLSGRIMSHAKSFYKLGKISYCVLLVHPMVISYLVNADESSRMDMFVSERLRLMMSCVCLSYLISFPLYLMFESPLASLTGLLFERRKPTTTTTTMETSSKTN